MMLPALRHWLMRLHWHRNTAEEGDVVLLSPGGTSYDAYKDFEARGDHFRQLVMAL